MATNAPQYFPQATQDGKAIPMDIGKPISAFLVEISAVHNDFSIPDGYFICSVYATSDCALCIGASLPDAIVVETEYLNTIFLQAETQYDIILTPGNASVLGLNDAGFLRITALQQWASLQQPGQMNRA